MDNDPPPTKEVKFLGMAIKMANKSKCCSRHGSIIYQGSRLLSVGYNKYKNSPMNLDWDYWSLHAEIDAMNKIKHYDNNNISLLVVRINKKGKLMSSRPCENCIERLKNKFNIHKIFYSTTAGEIVMERI